MDGIWFLVAVIFFVLWLAKKPKSNNDGDVDLNSKDYSQGYWDGYRAHKSEVTAGKLVHQTTPIIKEKDETSELGQLESINQVNTSEPYPHNRLDGSDAYSMAASTHVDQVVVNSAEQKAKHDLQNINITLYVASFLLVAAVALFVGESLPKEVRFIGVWFITIAFYSVGLILHKTVKKLRPAAVAFVGTGLAILPFTGIAMYSFVLPDAAACWFITSVIGLAAFIFAAVRLKNQVVAYLAIAFATSMATSSVAILHVGLMWYFVVLIIFGSVMTFLAKFKMSWVPECFANPIQKSNNWIVPLTITASLFAFNGMSITDYWVVSLVSAFYYGAVAASSVEGRQAAIFVTRLLASLTLVLMSYDISGKSWTEVGLTLSAVGLLQIAISILFLPKRKEGDSNNETWLWLGFSFQLFATLLVLQNSSWANIVTGQLAIMLISSFAVAYLLRRAVVSIFGTIALCVIPIIVGFNVIKPALEMYWVSLVLIILATIALSILSVKKLVTNSPSIKPYLVTNFTIFLIESLVFTLIISDGWGFSIWTFATVLVFGLMYLQRQAWVSLVANAMILITVLRFVEHNIESQWVPVIFLVFAASALSILSVKKLITNSPSIRPHLILNFGFFIIEALAFTLHIEPSWGFAVWLIASLLVYVLMYLERQPWLSVVANVMISVSILRFIEPEIEAHWVALIFIVFAAITFVVRYLTSKLKNFPSTRPALLSNIGMFIVESLFFTLGIGSSWGLVIWIIATMIVYGLVYIERQPSLSIIANVFFLVSCFWFIDLMEIPDIWRTIVISWIAFVVFYGSYWLLLSLSKQRYSIYFWWSAIIVAGIVNVTSLMNINEPIVVTASIGLIGVAIAVLIEGWRQGKFGYYDIGAILATIGMQRILAVAAPDANILIYTNWWAATFVGLSYTYYSAGKRIDAKIRVIIALTAVSLFSGLAALGSFGVSDIPYESIFLIEHVLILTSGLVLSRKLFTIWGAVGVILSVLWLIKGVGYLLLGLAAFVLIGFAIYALVRQSKNTK